MLLSIANIAFYLLDKGLITKKALINAQFTAHDASSRNHNFLINKELKENQYLVKQVSSLSAEKIETLKIEATCYWLANHEANYEMLKKFLPKYHLYDYMNHILITELIPNSQNLYEYFQISGNYNTLLGEQQADILSSYHHKVEKDATKNHSLRLFKQEKPWVFMIGSQDYRQAYQSDKLAEQQLMQLVYQNPTFINLIQALENTWEASSLIHGDIKFYNFLINKDYKIGEIPSQRLIDWELADIGDPLWDVAAIFNGYLLTWVISVASMAHPKKIELTDIQPIMSSFWKKYADLQSFDNATNQAKCLKTIQFLALKLIHSCFETTQGVENLQPHSAKILQLSLNILKDPQRAIKDLLGIKFVNQAKESFAIQY